MSEIRLPHKLVFLAEGQWRFDRESIAEVVWSQPGKRNAAENVEMREVYVRGVRIASNGDEEKVTVKVNGRFWNDFCKNVVQVDAIAQRFGGKYSPKEWVTTVDADKRLVDIS